MRRRAILDSKNPVELRRPRIVWRLKGLSRSSLPA
jgi:hypothetical protein